MSRGPEAGRRVRVIALKQLGGRDRGQAGGYNWTEAVCSHIFSLLPRLHQLLGLCEVFLLHLVSLVFPRLSPVCMCVSVSKNGLLILARLPPVSASGHRVALITAQPEEWKCSLLTAAAISYESF